MNSHHQYIVNPMQYKSNLDSSLMRYANAPTERGKDLHVTNNVLKHGF